ncbi:MAG: type I DNA topoisomerase, partial [Bacteroidota bacterium]
MANKKLVVVESPAKAKTINKYLGKNFVVEASVGHIKDLVKFRLGVDIDNGYEPKYITIRGKAPVIKKLKQLAGSSNEVLIATDPDREGEAIAWHIYQEVLEKNENVKRVLFNEITKNGVKEGIANPQEIDKNLFMSQQARRVMDRLIGYKVSPFLSRAMIEKTTEALSAGRVQSVALRLICERDSEIAAFSAIEYWNIAGDFSGEQGELKARLVAFDGDNIKNPEGSGDSPDEKEREKIRKKLESLHYIRNEKEANDLISRIEKQEFAISSINRKKVKRRPQPPFTTSLLQQEASRRLGYSNKKTMMLAQRLYEGVTMGDEGAVGLITYMRTDSMRISPQAMDQAKDFIKNNYSDVFLPDKPNVYKSKSSNVQDAHEAIRPTSMEFTPKEVRKYLGRDETRLYELIFNRFLASQMAPAVIDQTTVEISGGEFVFRVSGSVIAFKGFLIAYEDIKDEKSNG